ncbi:putative acetyltransferase [hydrothermal vent metagenome]|uniref:Putative acetyltransferase n=1 Tax=hydrothermal vent metagenome TaxID=652676 RepID=A0A3B0RRR5_9ZZZZ
MRYIDLNTWNRKQHFNHFSGLVDPSFAVTIPFDVTKAYQFSKQNNISFFAKYLHDCMKAINAVENLRYRIIDNKIVEYDVIHASPTLMRADKTFGFSFIDFDDDLQVFIKNFEAEKKRIQNSTDLFPPKNSVDCIYCSAMPWLHFVAHKEPFSGENDSVPKVAFSKVEHIDNALIMNVAINVNHALVDGYHVALFTEKFQENLDK